MARKYPRPAAKQQCLLVPFHQQCWECGKRLWVASSAVRTVTTLNGLCQLTLKIRRCQNPSCGRYHRSYRPEEEGHWALPHGEFGLDVLRSLARFATPITAAFQRSTESCSHEAC